MIKKRLTSEGNIEAFPFEAKLGIIRHEGVNPFIVARQTNHSVGLKIFKFRLLHMDIFTKERMFKYKMVTNENCDFCGVKETVKHVLWDCARARGVWNNLTIVLREIGLTTDIEFKNIFVGFKPTQIALEGIITRVSQILLRIDRENSVNERQLRLELLQLARQYIMVRFKSNMESERNIWEKLITNLRQRDPT